MIKIGCEKVKKASGTVKKPVYLSRWLTGVFETYEYQEEEPLPVPITAFYGSDDPEATRGETEGWERHTSGGFSLHEIPGGHFYLTHSSPLLLSHIRRVLGV